MKKRVISAIVALAIFIPLVIVGGIWFRIAACVVAVLGMKEFLELPGSKNRPKYVEVVFYALIILLTFIDENRNVYYFLGMLIPMLLVIYCNDNKKYNADDAFKLVGMLILLGTFFHELVAIRNDDVMIFIYLFLITILTDTYAHLGGTLIGKHNLAAKISPNKTWQGSVIGGVV